MSTLGPSPIQEEEALGKAYDARLMRRLLRYLGPHRAKVFWAVVLLVLAAGLQVVGPWLIQIGLDDAIPAGDGRLLATLAIAYLVSVVLGFFLEYGQQLLTTWLGQRVMYDLRTEIFEKLQRLDLRFYDRNPVGRLMTRITSDVETLNELFSSGVVSVFGDIFTLIFIFVAMLLLDWQLALVTFSVLPFVAWAAFLFRSRIREAYRDIRLRLARINAYLHERFTGVRVVQLFNREERDLRRLQEINDDYLEAHLRSITYYALFFPVIELFTAIALALIIWYGGISILADTISVGVVAAFLLYARRFFRPIQDLSEKYNLLQGAMASSERIFKLLDREEAIRDPEDPLHLPADGGGEIEFRDVWFAYDGARGAAAVPSGPSRSPGGNGRLARDGRPASRDGASPEAAGEPHVEPHGMPPRKPHGAPPGEPRAEPHGVPPGEPRGVPPGEPHGVPPREPEWVLKGVSFRVAPGEKVAIVGHTGAGKTTIINLLTRFYDIQRGEILLDGVPIERLTQAELRSRIGLVLQDVFLFSRDVDYNIRLGDVSIDDERVREAAREVGADRFIERLPGGYAQPLGERGTTLSVGERQLVSFARALAFDPRILVLDEATSSVDSEIEARIEEATDRLLRGRTSLVIAHRLSTVQGADRILVMHRGELREEGTHEELLAGGGLYARLHQLQFVRAGA